MNDIRRIAAEVLYHALSHRRPAGSREEQALARAIQDHFRDANLDAHGNLALEIGENAGDTIFCAHLDTVHRHAGPQKFARRQHIIRALDGAECLGADDAAGCAILAYLAASGVPGTYLWATCEEAGSIGAHALHDRGYFPTALRMISFDRRGTSDVCTSQMGIQGCSDQFAAALIDALRAQGLTYAPAAGIYTDSAIWIGEIPNVVNISVGYHNEHTPKEYLDLNHMWAIAEAARNIDWAGLPLDPAPKCDPSAPGWGGYSRDWADDLVLDTLERIQDRLPWILGDDAEEIIKDELYTMLEML